MKKLGRGILVITLLLCGCAGAVKDGVKLLEEKNYAELKEILITMNAADISSLFEEIPKGKIPLLFRLLPKVLAAEVFVEMEADAQAMLIQGFSDNELKEVLEELFILVKSSFILVQSKTPTSSR